MYLATDVMLHMHNSSNAQLRLYQHTGHLSQKRIKIGLIVKYVNSFTVKHCSHGDQGRSMWTTLSNWLLVFFCANSRDSKHIAVSPFELVRKKGAPECASQTQDPRFTLCPHVPFDAWKCDGTTCTEL